jgi:hypothetical protein
MASSSTSKNWEIVARLTVSLIILTVALYVILAGSYPDATVKWAFGAVGLVSGYWLR